MNCNPEMLHLFNPSAANGIPSDLGPQQIYPPCMVLETDLIEQSGISVFIMHMFFLVRLSSDIFRCFQCLRFLGIAILHAVFNEWVSCEVLWGSCHRLPDDLGALFSFKVI